MSSEYSSPSDSNTGLSSWRHRKNGKKCSMVSFIGPGMQTSKPIENAVKQRAKGSTKLARSPGVAGWSYGESDILGDKRPLPPVHPDPKEDEKLFNDTDPVVEPPISVDHGLNLKVGKGTFLNINLLVLDTCLVTIGERVLFGPNVCIYGATHPMDPAVRRGLEGPEAGKEVHIEDDVWIGGSAIILAGVTVGRGSTVGAGSVVTKVSLVLCLTTSSL
ncbi:sugar O-acetyltransferase [Aspergillus ibericus CBS 121593]|uniref:Trimeric LpxA-like protein n=1 Tax=Aspergillus ibericus CBS 121593 TaxID=1448316 RepID=A0A395H2Q3_9EURO|nr:trimeric LpxA-like protein [Aspergillus ibericus CBS 121593]RAL01679.1 trimeric LpxA-like protein [Aspergillus ibericus CBS 121593]